MLLLVVELSKTFVLIGWKEVTSIPY